MREKLIVLWCTEQGGARVREIEYRGRPFLNWRSGHCFIDVGAPVSEKVEPSSSGDNNDSSDGDPESSSDYDGCSSETEVLGVNHVLMILCLV